MKKKYFAPEMEVIDVNMNCILSGSDDPDFKEEQGHESNPPAPEMVFLDDFDEEE